MATTSKVLDFSLLLKDAPYSPSRSSTRGAFSILNDLIFDGKVKPFQKINYIETTKHHWGSCLGNTSKTGIRFCNLTIMQIFPSFIIFITVLAHEMVHNYQWVEFGIADHNKTFKDWKEKFESVHLKLEDTIGDDWIIYTRRKKKNVGRTLSKAAI